MEPVLSVCRPRIRIRLRDKSIRSIFYFTVRLVFLLFLPSFFCRGATAVALKSEAAVDGNRKEVADRVSSVQPRLGSTEPENCAARASPLFYDKFCMYLPYFIFLFFLSFFRCLSFPSLFALIVANLVQSLRGTWEGEHA